MGRVVLVVVLTVVFKDLPSRSSEEGSGDAMFVAGASKALNSDLVLDRRLSTSETARVPTRKPETDRSDLSRSEIVLLAGGGASLSDVRLVSLIAIAATAITATPSNTRTVLPRQLFCSKECTANHHFSCCFTDPTDRGRLSGS